MKTCAVLSVLGSDRIGAADDLAAALTERGIAIEDSRMTVLGGQFASIMQVCGAERDVKSLQHGLTTLGSNLGFYLKLEPVETRPTPVKAPRFVIESYAPGPEGIGAVTGILKRNNVNIEDLETDASPAPWTSHMTFHMKARISVPASCSVASLREELRGLERERDLDIVFKPTASMAAD